VGEMTPGMDKLKGLLGFQGASHIDKSAKDITETFEVILNIKANRSVTKKPIKRLQKIESTPDLPKYRMMPMRNPRPLKFQNLPNLLRNIQLAEMKKNNRKSELGELAKNTY
jgi:hypothetical protein